MTTSLVKLGEGQALMNCFGDEVIENEINTLHGEIAMCVKISMEKAIRIGELLTQQKEKSGHGYFTKWVCRRLPFTDRTARNYMKVYIERDRIKS